MMNDEVLTVFNDQQERIGTASRKEVHEKAIGTKYFTAGLSAAKMI